MAQNISATGACIYGIEPELKVGDVIGVQYEGKKARCKVVWVVDAGALKKTQVGVQFVADQDCPWVAVLPADMKADERTASSATTIAANLSAIRFLILWNCAMSA